jgi:hypothetical protein
MPTKGNDPIHIPSDIRRRERIEEKAIKVMLHVFGRWQRYRVFNQLMPPQTHNHHFAKYDTYREAKHPWIYRAQDTLESSPIHPI